MDSFFDIYYGGPTTEEFQREANLALVYKDTIDKATPILLQALNCDGIDDDCNRLWGKAEATLKAVATGSKSGDLFKPDGTPVGAIVGLESSPDAVWSAGVEGFIGKGKESFSDINADSQPLLVFISSWDMILERVSLSTGIDTEIVALSLKAMGDTAAGALAKGDKISLIGFGSFSISNRAARTGRNPQTGKAIQIAAKNMVKFKAGADLSGKVNWVHWQAKRSAR